MKFRFDVPKATQAAAFIIDRAGGSITKGFLVKILYAADRRQLRRIGKPITGDRPVSMEHGPVLSGILDLTNSKSNHNYWDRHISRAEKDTHAVRLLAPAATDLLTENEKESLSVAYDYFKNFSWTQMEEFFHTRFKEWENPGKSSKSISYERILEVTGKSPDFIADVKANQAEADFLEKHLA